jgi:hypothetical protein
MANAKINTTFASYGAKSYRSMMGAADAGMQAQTELIFGLLAWSKQTTYGGDLVHRSYTLTDEPVSAGRGKGTYKPRSTYINNLIWALFGEVVTSNTDEVVAMGTVKTPLFDATNGKENTRRRNIVVQNIKAVEHVAAYFILTGTEPTTRKVGRRELMRTTWEAYSGAWDAKDGDEKAFASNDRNDPITLDNAPFSIPKMTAIVKKAKKDRKLVLKGQPKQKNKPAPVTTKTAASVQTATITELCDQLILTICKLSPDAVKKITVGEIKMTGRDKSKLTKDQLRNNGLRYLTLHLANMYGIDQLKNEVDEINAKEDAEAAMKKENATARNG